MKEQILEAAVVKGYDGTVYSIGSFGSRVNFYAQQNRALNLVWALRADSQIKPGGAPVAIIGGGVTGIMAAAALISLGIRVDVFETGAKAISRQSATQHRLVHPTINSWPKTAPDITTNLPFLEWHLGQCDLVAKSLIKQFEALQQAFEGSKAERSRILAGWPANDILDVAADLIMVKSDLPEDISYRLAIIAVGFGEERPFDPFDTREYWFPDGLETERDKNQAKYYVVSGCGDGGLIDTLRVAHVDFDRGMIAFHVAAELWDTPIAAEIKKAEETAAKDNDWGKLAAIYDWSAAEIANNRRYEQTQKRLSSSLTKFRQLVHLTDKNYSPPFSPNAAPIHKLLIAHAKRAGRVTFSSWPLLAGPPDLSVGGKHLPPTPYTKVVIRHGADPKVWLRRLLTKDQIDDLEAKQSKLADFVVDAAWDLFPTSQGMPLHDPTKDDFIDDRLQLAESALRWIDERAKISRVVGGFELTFPGEVPALARSPLFGIQTAARPRPKSTGIR